FAWIIGWDLVLEYAMSCAVVAAHWSHYLDEFLKTVFGINIPPQLLNDPFERVMVDGQMVHCWFNLPAVLIMAAVTTVLVIGIRESAVTNAILVVVKLGVVLFVIALGWGYTQRDNWTGVPVEKRHYTDIIDYLERHPELKEIVPENKRSELESGAQLI